MMNFRNWNFKDIASLHGALSRIVELIGGFPSSDQDAVQLYDGASTMLNAIEDQITDIASLDTAKGLSEKQLRLLMEIHSYHQLNNNPPSVRALQNRMGYRSPSTITFHVAKLMEGGWVIKNGKRGLMLNPDRIKSVESILQNSLRNGKTITKVRKASER